MTLNLDMDADYQKEFDFDLEETGKKVMEGLWIMKIVPMRQK